MELLTEFPIARSDSVMMVNREGQLMLWGGYTQTILGEGDDRFIVAINLPGEFAIISVPKPVEIWLYINRHGQCGQICGGV